MLSFREFFSTALLTFSSFTWAAVITHPPNLLLTSPDLSNTFPNISLPSNQTISSPSNTLPPSPYDYPIPTAPATIVTIYGYTSPISELSAIECILSATEDVHTALEAAVRDHDFDRVMRHRYIRIDSEHALLTVANVDRQLKWTTWGQALRALTAFLYQWEFVGFSFVVVEQGVRVAVGVLAAR